MKSIIRWPGLIAFFVIIGLVAVISIVFMDVWIKLGAEKGLAQATGAEVNIASVEHSFSPFGVTFNHVQLTDPKKPNTNQIEAEVVSARINVAPLLLRKLVIDELIVQNAQFGTERESDGDVYVQRNDNSTDIEELLGDTIKVPTVDELLEKSPLKTTQAVQDTQALYYQHNEKLKVLYANLPSKTQLADYQAQAKALSQTDYKNPAELIKAQQEFEQLKQAVLADKQKIEAFSKALRQAKNDMASQLVKLKSAPEHDYQQLKALATGDPDAISDVTQLVFGDQAAKWSQYGLAAFDILAPMLSNKRQQEPLQEQAKGQWIGFNDTSKLPELWIKQASVSVKYNDEAISSKWTDITHQHDILGKPTLFSIDSSASKFWQSVEIQGDLWLAEEGTRAKQTWQLVGLKLSDLGLVDSDKIKGQLDKGLLSSTGQLKLNGEILSGQGLVDLTALTINATGTNKLTNTIASTLNQMKQLQLNTDIGGTLGDLDLKVSSNLAEQMGSTLLSSVSPEQKAKLDELKQKLNSKISGTLGESESQLSQWLSWEELADGNLTSLNGVLQTKIDSVIDKQKNKLLDKLLN